MDELKKGHDGTYHKKHLSDEERAILWHIARFVALKAGLAITINRFARNWRAMEDKRQIIDLLKQIDETAEKLKGMES